jgi:hypothetical protein
MGRKRIKTAALGLGFLLAAFWVAHIAAVVYVARTEWYLAAEWFIRASPEVSADVGGITGTSFIAGGASRSSSSSDWKDAQLRVRVTGNRGTAIVWMTLIKVSGVWKPTAAALNDENGRRLKLQ